MKSNTSGFTLIELLSVMAVLALLVGALVPAVNNFGRATSLQTAGGKVSSLLTLARQNSIARGAMTAVVIVTEPSVEERHRAMAIYEITSKADGTMPDPSDWKQINRWEILPEGIVFDQSTFQSDRSGILPALPIVSFRGQTTGNYRYVVFLPNGSIYNPNANSIRLVEGTWPKGAISPTYTRPTGAGSPANFFNVSIIGASGRLKIDQP